MSNESERNLLSELQALRARMDERLDVIQPQIATLSSEMKDLLGNGKPGRIRTLEADVAALKTRKAWLNGYTAFVVSISGVLLVLHDHVAGFIQNLIK